uniref:neurofibromin-like n=1 Tax=Styela clava TaxID=7725 RepID=UPI00193949B3|nr:neurofibromin-like [Styela clava]
MATQRPKEWVTTVISRFDSQLPSKAAQFTPACRANLEKHKECMINISRTRFTTVITGLTEILKNLASIRIYGGRQERNLYTSQIIVLDTLEKCISGQHKDKSSTIDESILIKQLLPEICQFIHQSSIDNNLSSQLKACASRVLYCLSQNNFNTVFSRISARLQDLSRNSDDIPDLNDLDLIQHIHVDMVKITKLLEDVVQRFRSFRKNVQIAISVNLEKAIWNWLHSYPADLCALYYPEIAVQNQLQHMHPLFCVVGTQGQVSQAHQQQYKTLLQQQKVHNQHLAEAADKLFGMLDTSSEGSKRKASTCWPLQIMLLTLCPDVIREIAFSSNQSMKPEMKARKEWFNCLQKALTSRHNQENSAISFTRMLKAATCIPSPSASSVSSVPASAATTTPTVQTARPTEDKCPLHELIHMVLPDLKALLFENGGKGFSKISDQDVLVECLVSCLRLQPNDDKVARTCVAPSAPIHLKMALVQAMKCIATQHPLLWWPRIDSFYNLGPEMRKAFLDVTPKVLGQGTASARTSQSFLREQMERMNVSLKRSQEESISHRDLMQALIQMTIADQRPFLFDLGNTNQKIHSNCWDFIRTLTNLVIPMQPIFGVQTSLEAMEALLQLHSPQISLTWNPESPVTTFWDVSSTMLFNVCCHILTEQMSTPADVACNNLKWLLQILGCRIAFLYQNHERGVAYRAEVVKRAQMKVEMVLLEYLWSLDTEVVLVALSCFRYLHEEIEIKWRFDESALGRMLPEYHELYVDLASAGTAIQNGYGTLHKKVTDLLRRCCKFTPASLDAWEDTRIKWESKTMPLMMTKPGKFDDIPSIGENSNAPSTVRNPVRRNIPGENPMEWINMTGFLCALGGVCVNAKDHSFNLKQLWERKVGGRSMSSRVQTRSTSSSTPALHTTSTGLPHSSISSYSLGNAEGPAQRLSIPNTSSATMSTASASSAAPARNTGPPTPYERASGFIATLLKLLSHQYLSKVSPDIKNALRNLLGTALHPALYPILFQQTKLHLKTLYDPLGQMLINEGNTTFVNHIILILESLLENCTELDTDHLGEESIESMVLQLVRYVRHMPNNMKSFHMRIHLCKMIELMMRQKNNLFFLSEIKFRNRLVEYVTDWIMDSSNHCAENSVPDDTKMLLRQLDGAAMGAVVVLLQDLPLQPDEVDGGDVANAKSQLFLKYFTLFMKLLNECNESSVHNSTNSLAPDDTAGSTAHSTVIKQLMALRHSTILAMSNMLSANIEYGFVHAMVLAYHTDFHTRSAFLEVLTKILQQQGPVRFDMLKDTTLSDRFDHLVELVTMMGDGGELPIANALANVVHSMHMDELARVFVTLFDAKHLLYQLLWNMFSKEVEYAENVQILFRGNSLASKIMTFCFKVYGASYLHNLMEPLIAWSLGNEIVNSKFEVDVHRLPDNADINQSRINLQHLTERFFTRIMKSTDKFPPQLKSVCHCLYQVVSQRFPENGTGAVASAVFLRFLNPAIVSPYEFGLTEKKLPPNLSRAFKLMCKIMQKISNHVLFTKEAHMKPFNDFVRKRFDACQQFFMKISSPESPSGEGVFHTMPLISDTNVAALHRLLWNNQEKIGEYLARSRDAKAVGRKPFDKMVTLLAYLGPPEYNRPALETRISGLNLNSSKFEDLMAKRKTADMEEFKALKGLNIFYQSGHSKMGHPVFYYIARRYKTDEIREDLLMYYVLLAVKPFIARKFEIVIDLTHVGPHNRFKRDFLPKWLLMFPALTYKNLDVVYLYNTNSWFKEYVKYHDDVFSSWKGCKSLTFIDHLPQLEEYIETEQQKIPIATVELDDDVTVYYNALWSGHKDTKVNIKVGAKAVQVTGAERCKVLGHSIILNDIYYASEIEHLCLLDDQLTFIMKVSTSNEGMNFSHLDAAKVAEAIQHIRTRWELSKPESTSAHQKISAKDVPGTLISIALLNLGYSKPMVRSAAYNLLCAVASAFELEVQSQLCESAGLCIPANNTLFIVSLSCALSKKQSYVTLELLEECITGFCHSTSELKNLCLEFMEPWLFNLPSFLKHADEPKRTKILSIIHRLIELTVDEKDFYPSVQTKIWGSIGQMPDLIDMVLDAFIETSAREGLGSKEAEVMADTSVALAANNMKLVSSKIISRLCEIVDKTSLRPTPTLEKHRHWEDIAILARYLLMLSFNNNLDVTTHLPYLCHLVTLLLHTGPLSLRASIHGLVVNIIHSLLTCKQTQFKEESQQVLRLSLTEFCLPKFYRLFGISKVKSPVDTAFQPTSPEEFQGYLGAGLESGSINDIIIEEDNEVINLSFVDVITDALLEVMEACGKDIVNCQWINVWSKLSHKFAFQYNPSLQARALVVLGCISKQIGPRHIKQILRIMGRSLESHADLNLLEATLLCFTRLQLVMQADFEIHSIFFWIGIAALQLEDTSIYSAGLSLIEQNLNHLDEMNVFGKQPPASFLMNMRSRLERHFQQLDQALGISFKSRFHFAFVSYILKGFRHPDSSVVSRAIRILQFMLELTSRHRQCEKYEVNPDSVAYLTALLPVSAEVQRYCGTRIKPGSSSSSRQSTSSSTIGKSSSHRQLHPPAQLQQRRPSNGSQPSTVTVTTAMVSCSVPPQVVTDDIENNSDAKSTDSHSSRRSARNPSPLPTEPDVSQQRYAPAIPAKSTELSATPLRIKKGLSTSSKRHDGRENTSTPTKLRRVCEGMSHDSDSSTCSSSGAGPSHRVNGSRSRRGPSSCKHSSSTSSSAKSSSSRHSRRKLSTDPAFNVLLDDEMLQDNESQALLLTILATQIRYWSDDLEARVLYEYLAEASVVFPEVFPIVHSLLDQKISSLLNNCQDLSILSAVQMIVHNSVCNDETRGQHQTSFLQNIGFGGVWKYAGPFPQSVNLDNTSTLVNLIDAVVTGYFGDVADLTPVASRQSLNSTLSAASGEDLRYEEGSDEGLSSDNLSENEEAMNETLCSSPQASAAQTQAPATSPSGKTPSFRQRGPKLTIPISK